MPKLPVIDTFEVLSRELRVLRGQSGEHEPVEGGPWPRPIRERFTEVIRRAFKLLNALGLDRTKALLAQFEEVLQKNLGHRMAICKVGYGGGPLENLPKADEHARYGSLCDDLQQVIHAARLEFPEDVVIQMKAAGTKDVSPESMKSYVAVRLGISMQTLRNKVSTATKGWKPGEKVKASDRGAGLPWVVFNDMAGEWLVSSIDAFEQWLTTPIGQQWKKSPPKKKKGPSLLE